MLNTNRLNRFKKATLQLRITSTKLSMPKNTASISAKKDKNQDLPADFQLLLTPAFATMSKITDHLFLTGVGGMTKENFRKNHIDYVVNTTTEAPFWDDIDSLRVAVEDDSNANIYPYFDPVADRIQDVVSRNGHVLVHCLAGVSRSASIVIAWLMKYKRMDLKSAFNHCYIQRPVIRPNNGFLNQLMAYEKHLFNTNSIQMIEVDVDGTQIIVPHFFLEEHPKLVMLEVLRAKAATRICEPVKQPETNRSPATIQNSHKVSALEVTKRINQAERSTSASRNRFDQSGSLPITDDAHIRQMQAQYELSKLNKTKKRLTVKKATKK